MEREFKYLRYDAIAANIMGRPTIVKFIDDGRAINKISLEFNDYFKFSLETGLSSRGPGKGIWERRVQAMEQSHRDEMARYMDASFPLRDLSGPAAHDAVFALFLRDTLFRGIDVLLNAYVPDFLQPGLTITDVLATFIWAKFDVTPDGSLSSASQTTNIDQGGMGQVSSIDNRIAFLRRHKHYIHYRYKPANEYSAQERNDLFFISIARYWIPKQGLTGGQVFFTICQSGQCDYVDSVHSASALLTATLSQYVKASYLCNGRACEREATVTDGRYVYCSQQCYDGVK
jgi:hypothetical protein